MTEKIDCHDFLARSEATKQSREGKRACTGLLRYARNDDGQKIAASSAAMTGSKWTATIFLRKLLGGDTFIYELFDNQTNCVIIKKNI